jgi:hypothetical protein
MIDEKARGPYMRDHDAQQMVPSESHASAVFSIGCLHDESSTTSTSPDSSRDRSFARYCQPAHSRLPDLYDLTRLNEDA